MPKKDDLPMSGYIPDIKGNKPFLQTYNRHSDSYSVFDLKPEIILISSRLSQLLHQIDDIDPTLLSHHWGEIMALIEVKRRLIDTTTKIGELLFKQKQTERMNDARIKQMFEKTVSYADFVSLVDDFTRLVSNFLSHEELESFTRELSLKLKILEANE